VIQIPIRVILVRHSPAGTYFLVRAAEETPALLVLEKSYPGAGLEILERSGELLLLRVLRPGSAHEDSDDPPPSLRSVSFGSGPPSRERPRDESGPEPGKG
jgi:hypothetical protein